MMRAAWTLREVQTADVDAIMAVMDAAFDPHYGEAWNAGQLTSLFVLPGIRVAAAWWNDGASGPVPAGFYAARRVGSESELLLLAVTPACRRRGLGQALLRDWKCWAKDAGCTTLLLEVRADNPARKLYDHEGFEPVGLRRNYYRGLNNCLYDAITLCHHLGT